MAHITARVIKDSVYGVHRLTTLEITFPRFILAEMLTHRQLSRNTSSSRAISVAAMISQIRKTPAVPVHWGQNQPGMQASRQTDARVTIDGKSYSNRDAWLHARDRALETAAAFADSNYHKQVVNRLLEPWAMVKMVCSATEWSNFFELRCHPDAQPEIRVLAERMQAELADSRPERLDPDQFHLPYVDNAEWAACEAWAAEVPGRTVTDAALKLSASCCAQVSYRTTDTSLTKAFKIHERLVGSHPRHYSPFEHQARPILSMKDHGITHVDRMGRPWSGNFCGFVQHRQIMDNLNM